MTKIIYVVERWVEDNCGVDSVWDEDGFLDNYQLFVAPGGKKWQDYWLISVHAPNLLNPNHISNYITLDKYKEGLLHD